MAGVNLHEHIETKKAKNPLKKKRSSGPCLIQDNKSAAGLASYTVLDEWMEKAEMEIETKKMEDKWKTRNEGTNDNNHPYPPDTLLLG